MGCVELGTQMWYVFVTWLPLAPAFNSPWEATLFNFSVTPSCPGLAWGDREATEESKQNEIETRGSHGTEQALAASAAF